MDDQSSTSPLEAPPAWESARIRRSRRALWTRLLLILAVIVAPLVYIIGEQSPDLLPSVVATFTPPTPTPIPTATPVPLSTILRARPLRLPTLSPGSACPVTPSHIIDADIGAEVGDGPVYLYSVQSTVFFRPTQSGGAQGWVAGQLWLLIKPGVEGAVLVRGHQVGGPNEIRFGQGDAPDPELVFKAPAQAHPDGISNPWTVEFADIRLREAGCYAIQIDSEAASSVIVFRAEPQ